MPKASSSRRPLVITGLSITMIGFSLIATNSRFQNLRSLPSIYPFVQNIYDQDLQNLGMPISELVVNIGFFSNAVILITSFIPLVLGIGLWYLCGWARAISMCLFSATLLPNLLAAINLINDRGATTGANLTISLGSILGLVILLNPAIATTFRNHNKNHNRKKHP